MREFLILAAIVAIFIAAAVAVYEVSPGMAGVVMFVEVVILPMIIDVIMYTEEEE